MNGANSNARKKVGMLVFPEVELLDFAGPFEVLTSTRLDESVRRDTESPFQVMLVSQTKDAITTTGGVRVLPDYDFATCPKLDILLVPGGWGTRVLLNNHEYTEWIKARAAEVERLTSVCTGSLLLANAGLLVGRSATTHLGAFELFHEKFPEVTLERHLHVVEDGHILTSAGISAGIHLALLLVRQYCGEKVARATATYMEYPYPESNVRRARVGIGQ